MKKLFKIGEEARIYEGAVLSELRLEEEAFSGHIQNQRVVFIRKSVLDLIKNLEQFFEAHFLLPAHTIAWDGLSVDFIDRVNHMLGWSRLAAIDDVWNVGEEGLEVGSETSHFQPLRVIESGCFQLDKCSRFVNGIDFCSIEHFDLIGALCQCGSQNQLGTSIRRQFFVFAVRFFVLIQSEILLEFEARWTRESIRAIVAHQNDSILANRLNFPWLESVRGLSDGDENFAIRNEICPDRFSQRSSPHRCLPNIIKH